MIKWLFWQTSSQGPLLGQAAHFVSHAAQRGIVDDYAVERYRNEALRLHGVLDDRLGRHEYIGGAEFSFPHQQRWCEAVAARPSARKKLERDDATKEAAKTRYYDDATWALLFGSQAGSAPRAAGS